MRKAVGKEAKKDEEMEEEGGKQREEKENRCWKVV